MRRNEIPQRRFSFLKKIRGNCFPFNAAQSSWIQLCGGISTTPQTVAATRRLFVPFEWLSLLSDSSLWLRPAITGHTCATVQRRAISTSPRDACGTLKRHKVVDWGRPRHRRRKGTICVLPQHSDTYPTRQLYPPNVLHFLTFVFILVC